MILLVWEEAINTKTEEILRFSGKIIALTLLVLEEVANTGTPWFSNKIIALILIGFVCLLYGPFDNELKLLTNMGFFSHLDVEFACVLPGTVTRSGDRSPF